MFDQILIKNSGNRGKGIFAARWFSSGEAINVSYSWILTPQDLDLYEQTSIGGYWFKHPDRIGYGLLPIGAAAFVNHARPCNAELSWRSTELGYLGVLIAVRDICPDEEILIDYGPGIDY